MNKERRDQRLKESVQNVDKEVFMSDNREDLLLLAGVLMTSSIRIYRNLLGEIGLKNILKNLVLRMC